MTVFRWSLGAGHALVLALAIGAMAPAAAVPLDASACEQLQVQLDALRSEGAAADMARGPEWARANLPEDRLRRVGLLLEVEEKLNFRCGLAKITLPNTIEGGEEDVPAPGEATIEGSGSTIALPQKAPSGRPAAAAASTAPPPKARATTPAVTKQQPAKKAVSAPAQKTVKDAEPPATTTIPKKAPAKKKPPPKADDAYRPPPRTGEGGGAALGPKQ
jgi:hypothetical protein